MIVTVRNGVFETNSSSCHVITIARRSDWADFRSGKTGWKKSSYAIEEHETITYRLQDEDIIDLDKAFKKVKKTLTAENDEVFNNRFADDPLTKNVWQYVKDNFSRKMFDDFLNGYGQPKIPFDKPVVVHYKWSDKDVTYYESTTDTINHVIDWALCDMNGYDPIMTFEGPEFQGCANVELMSKGKMKTIFEFKAPEDDGEITVGDFKIIKKGNHFTVKADKTLLDENVLIETDFEC